MGGAEAFFESTHDLFLLLPLGVEFYFYYLTHTPQVLYFFSGPPPQNK